MERYYVTVERTEVITFIVYADSYDEAVCRYLSEGDELVSNTIGLEIVEVVTEQEARGADRS